MKDTQVYWNIFARYRTWIGWATDGLDQPAIDWRPDPKANNIALTLWHMARALDVLTQRIFTNNGSEAELWSCKGWAEKYNYDPSGKGWGGLGNLAGYGPEEITEMPQFTLDDLIEYFDQCLEAVDQYLQTCSPDNLDQPVPFWPDRERSIRQVLEMFLMDGLAHMGEIRALRAMWERLQT